MWLHKTTHHTPATECITWTPQVTSASVGFVKVELYHPSTKLVDGKLLLGVPDAASAEATAEPSSSGGSAAAAAGALPRQQLLCNIRSLLKKLRKHVLVGDQVCVGSVDWNHGRGTVEDVLERTSELADPAIANVDHALLVFALANPPVSRACRMLAVVA
jgi:hypothetical protein